MRQAGKLLLGVLILACNSDVPTDPVDRQLISTAEILAAAVVPGGWIGVNGTSSPWHHGTYPSWGNRTHIGVDIWNKPWTSTCNTTDNIRKTVYPIADGTIVAILDNGYDRATGEFRRGFGTAVMIRHPGLDGAFGNRPTWSVYLHLRALPVQRQLGETVVRGITPLGVVGTENNVCHIHFEIRHFGREVEDATPSADDWRIGPWGNTPDIYGPLGYDVSGTPEFAQYWSDPYEILRDGTVTQVTTHPLPPEMGFVTRIWGSSSNDIYAFGSNESGDESMVYHFDGQNWQRSLTIPVQHNAGQWWGVAGSPGAFFATTGGGGGDGWPGRLLKFYGNAWTEVGIPAGMRAISGPWGSSYSNLWLILLGDASRSYTNYVYRFNGQRWRAVFKTKEFIIGCGWSSDPSQFVTCAVVNNQPAKMLHYDGTKASNQWTFKTIGQAYPQVNPNGLWGTDVNSLYAYGQNGIYRFDGASWQAVGVPIAYPILLSGAVRDRFYAGGCASISPCIHVFGFYSDGQFTELRRDADVYYQDLLVLSEEDYWTVNYSASQWPLGWLEHAQFK